MSASRFTRWIEGRVAVPVAVAITLGLGLFFVFVRAPHPWGWFGIDQYHYLAMEMARGGEFATLDVPWAYAYVLAAFYRVFGPTPLPVLLLQVVLNAAIPAIVYAYAREAFDRRVAAISALLISVLSFNTIYASTESTDSICTFLFVVMVWTFVRARRRNGWGTFALVGALCGIAAQFRPNLVLVPFMLWALNPWLGPRTMRRVLEGAVIVVVAVLTLTPWTMRNYRLTGQFLPTSTHGGVQLWYGTLQTGPYLRSRALNPRSIFEAAPFDYTSLQDVPILVDLGVPCGPGLPAGVDLVYRLDQGAPLRLAMTHTGNAHYTAAIPPPHHPVHLTYFVEVTWPPGAADPPVHTFPAGGAADPLAYFVSDDHVGDLDSDHTMLDVFDVAHVLSRAWFDPAHYEADLRELLRRMFQYLDKGEKPDERLARVSVTPASATAIFTDGSTLTVPRDWDEKFTSLEIGSGFASALISSRARRAAPFPAPRVPLSTQCLAPGSVAINAAYFRVQPHEQRRFVALAFDNIRRGPVDYALSVLFRAVRLFVIEGTDDRRTAFQFDGSGVVYLVGTIASATYLLLFVAGTWIAWKRGYALWLPLALILYLPATISFVLTNMRYTITVQPLLLIFAGVAVEATLRRFRLIDP